MSITNPSLPFDIIAIVNSWLSIYAKAFRIPTYDLCVYSERESFHHVLPIKRVTMGASSFKHTSIIECLVYAEKLFCFLF
jgi:hypothetical protein